jgi:hypothetical protein
MDDASQKAIDTIGELIEERLNAVARNEEHIGSLEDENGRIKGEIRGLELAAKLFDARYTEMPLGALAPVGKYTNMSLTDSVFDIIQTEGTPPGLTGSAIIRYLNEGGFKSQAKDPYTSTYGVAMGLVKQGRIREVRNKEEKRLFMRKP